MMERSRASVNPENCPGQRQATQIHFLGQGPAHQLTMQESVQVFSLILLPKDYPFRIDHQWADHRIAP